MIFILNYKIQELKSDPKIPKIKPFQMYSYANKQHISCKTKRLLFKNYKKSVFLKHQTIISPDTESAKVWT